MFFHFIYNKRVANIISILVTHVSHDRND